MKNNNLQKQIEEKIYQQFITPTKQKKNYIGIEIEMPIINLNKKAVDFQTVHKITTKILNYFTDFKTESVYYNGDTFSIKNTKKQSYNPGSAGYFTMMIFG